MTARPTSPLIVPATRVASSIASRRPASCSSSISARVSSATISAMPMSTSATFSSTRARRWRHSDMRPGCSAPTRPISSSMARAHPTRSSPMPCCAQGDLVLFDRNNHKSLHQGALVQAGAIPIFLPTSRNAFGMIGAVDWDAWDEDYSARADPRQPTCRRIARDPKSDRPFRLACIQLATYDGTIYNVQKVLEKIGHLCDYVLWDEAWIGYNAFHPLFENHSPMRLRNWGRKCPGCSPPSRCTSRAPASRKPRRSTSATSISGSEPLRRAQAFQRIIPDECLDIAILPLVCIARRQCQDP